MVELDHPSPGLSLEEHDTRDLDVLDLVGVHVDAEVHPLNERQLETTQVFQRATAVKVDAHQVLRAR